MTAVAEPEIGKARVRKEDARLITGRSRYTDAITPPGTLHLYVVRSPLAHAHDHRRSTSPRPQGRRASSASTPPPTWASRPSACPARGRSPRT